LYIRGFLKAQILFLFFEPKFEEENQTQLFGAGGEICLSAIVSFSQNRFDFSRLVM